MLQRSVQGAAARGGVSPNQQGPTLMAEFVLSELVQWAAHANTAHAQVDVLISEFVRWAAQTDTERFRECALDHRPPCWLHELREVCLASLVRRRRREDGRDAAHVAEQISDGAAPFQPAHSQRFKADVFCSSSSIVSK